MNQTFWSGFKQSKRKRKIVFFFFIKSLKATGVRQTFFSFCGQGNTGQKPEQISGNTTEI